MTSNKSFFSSRSRDIQVTICPCCGVKFAGDFHRGCLSCGAQSVGEPLPKPEHELPSYGRALLLVSMGAILLLLLVTQTVFAFVKQAPISFEFWSWAKAWINAGQVAAWHLKWIAIPVTLHVIIHGRRIYQSIVREPERFCGAKHARRGLLASTVFCTVVALFIGLSVPGRIRNRRLALEAAYNAKVYRVDRALLEYGIKFKTLPSDPKDLLDNLPDPDGSLALALNELGPLNPGVYKPSGADLAALPQGKPRRLQGLVIRNAASDSASDDRLPTGWSFTNYELRLSGPDKLYGTDDDLVVRDGLITKASDAGPGVIGSTASYNALKP
jgi:hypothetical protein